MYTNRKYVFVFSMSATRKVLAGMAKKIVVLCIRSVGKCLTFRRTA